MVNWGGSFAHLLELEPKDGRISPQCGRWNCYETDVVDYPLKNPFHYASVLGTKRVKTKKGKYV